MLTLLHWIYINEKNTWSVYCNGKVSSTFKTPEQAIQYAHTLAFKNTEKSGYSFQILIQNTDGSIGLVEQYNAQRLLV